LDVNTRRGFLNLAAYFEGATLLVGVLLGWASGTFPAGTLRFTGSDFVWGVAAVVPLLPLLVFAQDLRRQVREMLGEPLSQCRWYDLAALALLAGLSEELLFRGVLEPWIGRWDPWVGLIAANVLFGLAHAVSAKYLLFAALIGVYFSLLKHGWPAWGGAMGEQNLLRPIVAHAVYDLLAFLVIVRDYRCEPTAADADANGAALDKPAEQEAAAPTVEESTDSESVK
jgi:hypothetical protein